MHTSQSRLAPLCDPLGALQVPLTTLGQLGDTDKARGGEAPGLWMRSTGFQLPGGCLEPGGVGEGGLGASPWGRVTGQ